MAREDIYQKNKTLEKYTKRCIARMHPKDREGVGQYLDDLLSNGYSVQRVHKIASILSKVSGRMKTALVDASKNDVKRYSAWLEKSSYSDWTKRDHKIILRGYMRWLGKPEAVDWMKIKKSKNGRLPEEILTEQDIKKLTEAAYSTRDKAFILALYESGCRIGEFLPLRIRHVSFDKYGTVLHIPEGKTGSRRIRLVASTLALQRWLEEHPQGEPEHYLWCPLPTSNNPKSTNRHLDYDYLRRLLRELAAKAGVKKRVNPHSFRHARATFMARHLKEPEMREFFGWGKDSEMPAIYVHLSGRDVDDSVLSIYGIKEAANSQDPMLKSSECPRCGETNDSTRLYCGRCGLPFTDEVIREERLESVLVDFMRLLSERMPEARGIFQELVTKHGLQQ